MANLTSIAPGGSATFTAQPLDQNGNPFQQPSGFTLTWSVTNPAAASIAPSTADPTGLTAIATVPVGAATGATFAPIITSSPLADGTTPTGTGPVQTVVVLEIASYVVTRTA